MSRGKHFCGCCGEQIGAGTRTDPHHVVRGRRVRPHPPSREGERPMSEHAHPTFVDGCYRCDLGKDELQVSAHDVPLPEPVAWGIRDHAHGGWWLYEEDPGYEEGERVALIPAPAVEQYGRDSAAAERAAIVVWIESRTQTFRTELGLARVAGVVCPVLDLLAEGIADGEHLPGARGGEGT